ncbi:MAG: hypothetical protein A4S12_11515 [Proteobacteria bacterium SG_bin5]|nr:DOMON-like domain-containing protein [Sphingomonas sp.]OQW39426.1 MAG: hypothetical protein A4S12_11515 [Proteobacteria bacterium SG_bin5]
MTMLTLHPHPSNPSAAIQDVAVSVRRRADRLALSFRPQGDPSAIVWPAEQPGGFSDGLWRHTCFEAFITTRGVAGYVELNLAPSGRWAAYRFSDYRAGMARGVSAPGPICAAAWPPTLIAGVRLADVPSGADWWLNLAAVIELAGGDRAYFALAHAEGNPDFHHPDCFRLHLPAGA